MSTVQLFKVRGLENLDKEKDVHELVKSYLGLEGKSNPFQLMTTNLRNVMQEVCPVKIEYKKYRTNAIPTDVLNMICDLEKVKMFGRIEIWYDDVTPDPICVGVVENYGVHVKNKSFHEDNKRFDNKEDCENYIKEKGYEDCEAYGMSWEEKRYLVARWGDEMKPLEDIAIIAKKRFIARKKHEYTKAVVEAQGKLTMLELEADQSFLI